MKISRIEQTNKQQQKKNLAGSPTNGPDNKPDSFFNLFFFFFCFHHVSDFLAIDTYDRYITRTIYMNDMGVMIWKQTKKY